MQLQEIIEEEASKVLEIYRLAGTAGEDLENLTIEELEELVDYMIATYDQVDDLF